MCDYLADFTDLTAILYTHVHGDHYNAEIHTKILEQNPDISVFTPKDFPESGEVWEEQEYRVGEVSCIPKYEKHLEIYGEHGQVPLVTLSFDGKVFFSSDTCAIPDFTPDVLLFPIG